MLVDSPRFLLLQTQFFCLAVVQGKLKLFYDFDGELKEPASVNSGYLSVSDADKKTVSFLHPNCLWHGSLMHVIPLKLWLFFSLRLK